MKDSNNPLLCNPESGVCEMPSNLATDLNTKEIKAIENPIKVIYFTDPICSSCWGIEPQLRKLKLEYGNNLEIDYRMGGLLPDWSYNSGGISKPSDVAHHWDEVSLYYDMPIDGDVWLEDPLNSSYPPSIAFKAAQMQDKEKAIVFLRLIREMVFLQKKNITKWEYIKLAAENAGLNTDQLKTDFEDQAKNLFYADLKLARELGVRGFPTMIFVNTNGVSETVYGFKPYAAYEEVIRKLEPSIQKYNYDKSAKSVFAKYHSLTVKEFSVLTDTPKNQAEILLNNLTAIGKLKKTTTKNGSIWTKTNADL
ncbi:ClpXP adapter SpxH family protein [Flavobacterium adhaerens]|uniref:ClpXP adapter SpxH family protein n=1 Tax=Flavobacterium adhaerens TaxID=3149043 RepID=UPI0032B46713